MGFDQERHIKFKANSKTRYFNLKSVYSPALKAQVHFNSDGFYHMLFRTSREKRNVSQQYSRLILIPLLKPVLRNSKRIHETRVEEVTIKGVKKVRTCFALVEYVGDDLDAKVKVIVRRVGNGNLYFHSAMKLNKNIPKSKNTPKGV